jgi:hypothetical protein
MPMIATTIRSSIRVKPFERLLLSFIMLVLSSSLPVVMRVYK